MAGRRFALESPSCSPHGKRRPFSFAPSECSDCSELDVSSIAPADLPGRATPEADAACGGPSEPMHVERSPSWREDKLVSKVDASRPSCREESVAHEPETYCIGSPTDAVNAAGIRRRLYFDSPCSGSTFADKAADYMRRYSLESDRRFDTSPSALRPTLADKAADYMRRYSSEPRMCIRSDKDWMQSPDRRQLLTPESERRLPTSPGTQLNRALAPVLEDVARRARDGEASPSGWSQAEATLEVPSSITSSAVIGEAPDTSFSALSCELTHETSSVYQSVEHGASKLDNSNVEEYRWGARCCVVHWFLRMLLRFALCNLPALLLLNRQGLLDWSRGSSHLGVPQFLDSQIDRQSAEFKGWWPSMQFDGANNMNMYSETDQHTVSVNATEVWDPLAHSTAIISGVAVFVLGRVY